MHTQEYTTKIECPDCGYDFEVKCSLLIDPGTRYHADGSGTPPSEDFEATIPEHCPGCKQEFTQAKLEDLALSAREAAPNESWDGPEPDDLEPPDSWFDE